MQGKHVNDEDKLTRQFDWSGQNRKVTLLHNLVKQKSNAQKWTLLK
ncbi:hypothetical protein [Streptococcus equinus]